MGPPPRPSASSNRQPLSRCRMGFLIVFDVTQPDSFIGAKQIYHELKSSIRATHKVCLVANKMDKEPLAVKREHTLNAARELAASNGIYFMEVSALEFSRVRTLFRDALDEIVSEPEFGGKRAKKGTSDGDPDQKDCVVQ